MRHLTLETLARLVDDAPEAHEETHLGACEACRDELEALRAQSAALRTLPNVMPPPDAWPALRRRLRAEGVIRGGARRLGPAATPIAAALALFLAGGAVGYGVRGPVEAPAAGVVADAADGPAGSPLADGQSSIDEGRAEGAAPSGAELTEDVERTEEMFAAALDRFMRASGTEAPDPAARLAALDNIVLTTAEALNESPSDPVISSYHLTAVAQRRELIRQLTSAGDPVF